MPIEPQAIAIAIPIETPAIAIPLPRRPSGQRGRLIGLAGVLAVVAAIAVAGGLWLRADNRTTTAAVEQAPPAVAAAPATRVASADAFLTVNIVDSEDQKLRLEQGLDQVNATNAARGEQPVVNQVVLVAATDEEANRIMQRYSGHQDDLTLPVKFNDFRAQTAAPAATTPAAADTTMTVYLTGSAAATARIQADIVEENTIRQQAGTALLQEMVLTGDSADATLFLRDLQVQEVGNVRVVDMRTRPASTGSASIVGQELPSHDTPHSTP